MKKVISMSAILVMIGGLCTGCKNKDIEATQQSQQSNPNICVSKQSTANSSQCQHGQKTNCPEPEITQQSQQGDAENWEPETSQQSMTNSDRADHDCSHHDHSRHNH